MSETLSITSRERFRAALDCQAMDRPPIWIMRQAGRYLPEYRALKEKHSFIQMVKTPELALEVTMQPLRRFRLDAAILFSDILVVPEALGQGYHFQDQGGIAMDYRIDHPSKIDALDEKGMAEKLAYVRQALELISGELRGTRMLLGFGGSPWTLATYMVEGGSSKTFENIKTLFYASPRDFERLMEKITLSLIDYFRIQARAGADAIQIFDSWGGIIAGADYENASLKWIQRIVEAVGDEIPIILYSKGTSPQLKRQSAIMPKAIAVDWTIPIEQAASRIPDSIAIQGNLDPAILNASPNIVIETATDILLAMSDRPGHIFNLGHGIFPNARIESVEALVETVVAFAKR